MDMSDLETIATWLCKDMEPTYITIENNKVFVCDPVGETMGLECIEYNPVKDGYQLINLQKLLLMEYNCEFLTDDGQYMIIEYDNIGKVKDLLSHETYFETAILKATLEIIQKERI